MRFVLLIAICFFCLFLTGGCAEKVPPEVANPLETKASQLTRELAAGKFSDPTVFTAGMQAKNGLQVIQKTNKDLIATNGVMTITGDPTSRFEESYVCVYVPVKYGNLALHLKFVFDNDRKVAGLWTAGPPP